MSLPESEKAKLVVAIAKGMPVRRWADQNEVSPRTAYRWACDPRIRARVESWRQRALDRAIGKMSNSVNWAAKGIGTLAKEASSESVKLAALKTIFSNMIAVSEFADLKDRITELEEQLNERERAGRTGQAC